MNYRPNLKNLTREQKEIAFVIERTNYIEYQIKEIIMSYLQVDKNKGNFVKNILLNSGIISLGAKLKLLIHICDSKKWDVDKNLFHKIIEIRNAFAHNDTVTTNISINMTKKDKVKNVDVYMNLNMVDGSGKLKKVKRQIALQEFTNKYGEAEKFLNIIIKKIHAKK